MYAIIIIALSCVVSIAFLSKANIKITVNHVYPQAVVDKVDNSQTTVDKQIEDVYKKEKLPTFDEVLQVAQELIGGDPDAN